MLKLQSPLATLTLRSPPPKEIEQTISRVTTTDTHCQHKSICIFFAISIAMSRDWKSSNYQDRYTVSMPFNTYLSSFPLSRDLFQHLNMWMFRTPRTRRKERNIQEIRQTRDTIYTRLIRTRETITEPMSVLPTTIAAVENLSRDSVTLHYAIILHPVFHP